MMPETFEDYVRGMNDKHLRSFYDEVELFHGSGVLTGDSSIRFLTQHYFGKDNAINLTLASLVVYREIARRHYKAYGKTWCWDEDEMMPDLQEGCT